MLATSGFFYRWGTGFLFGGAVFTAVGLALRFLQRNMAKPEKDKLNRSYGGSDLYWSIYVGPVMLVVGVIFYVISLIEK